MNARLAGSDDPNNAAVFGRFAVSITHTSPSHLGVGLYSIADAARLLKAPTNKVLRWASVREGLVPRYFDPEERLISFAELMELHFIKMFRDEGVSLQAIRKASHKATAVFGSKYPFGFKRFDTDGRTIFATLITESNGVLVEDLQRGQYVFGSVMKPFFRKLEYKGTDSAVAQFWPRGKKGLVVLDPHRKFGKPIDAETGIPTRVIFDALHAGKGQKPKTVSEWLGVSIAAVNAALDFEKSLAA